MEQTTEKKTLEEILAMDTSQMSLSDLVEMLPHYDDPEQFAKAIFKIRLKHEDDTGVPMEEDEMGEQESELIEQKFGAITERL